MCRKYITHLSHPLPHIKQWHSWHHRKPHNLQHFKIAEQDIFCIFSVIKIKQCQIFPKVYTRFSPVRQNDWWRLEGLEKRVSPLFSVLPHANLHFLSNYFNLKWLNAKFSQNTHGKAEREQKSSTSIGTAQIRSKTPLQNFIAAPNTHPSCVHTTLNKGEKPWEATWGGSQMTALPLVQFQDSHSLPSPNLCSSQAFLQASCSYCSHRGVNLNVVHSGVKTQAGTRPFAGRGRLPGVPNAKGDAYPSCSPHPCVRHWASGQVADLNHME